MKPNLPLTTYKTLNETLEEVGINYFSLTMFNNGNKELISFCSNDNFQEIYNNLFYNKPPVKDYILANKGGFILWDEDVVDLKTAEYIKLRNNICQTQTIGTFIPTTEKLFTAISFGTPHDYSHIKNVYTKQCKIITKFYNEMIKLFSDCVG